MSETKPIGGRWGRWIGIFILVDFALVCTIKIVRGITGDIWWMSHMAAMIAGLGFIRRSALLICTALIGVFVLHSLWLVDCITWLLTDRFPLGITSYLADADVWAWAATAHHFVLVPLLVVTVLRHGRCPAASFPAAIALFLCLTTVSRVFLAPTPNVNFAFRVDTFLDNEFLAWANRLPGPAYLLVLNLFVAVAFLLPTYLALRLGCKARASREKGKKT